MNTRSRQAPPQRRSWTLSVSLVLFACLVAAGVYRSLSVYNQIPDLHFGYVQRVGHPANQNNASIKTLTTSALLNFDNAGAQLSLLQLARNRKDDVAVVEAFQGLLRISPFDAESHGDLASSLLNVGGVSEALLHSRIAIDLSPNNPRLLCIRGAALMADQQMNESAETYRRALAIDPESKTAKLALDFPLKGF